MVLVNDETCLVVNTYDTLQLGHNQRNAIQLRAVRAWRGDRVVCPSTEEILIIMIIVILLQQIIMIIIIIMMILMIIMILMIMMILIIIVIIMNVMHTIMMDLQP